ncbi:MAG: DMT family transporter [Vicinamibacterales bacterium]
MPSSARARQAVISHRFHLSSTDVLLLVMTLIWGANYTIVKAVLEEIPPLAFNSLRLALASTLFVAAIRAAGGAERAFPRISPKDWLLLSALGAVGHTLYQLCFMGGLYRTTASNASLIYGCSPVAVGLLSAAVGQEKLGAAHWTGAGLSVLGIYLLVGHGPDFSRTTLTGDLLLVGGLAFWAVYTVGSRPLLERYGALVVTGCSTIIGTVFYVPLGVPGLLRLRWSEVSAPAWLGLVFSAAFALFVAYLIWYTAVARIGSLRTSMYSNITPLVALVIAVMWLDEKMTPVKAVGGAAILTGAAVTRMVSSKAAPAPVEE